MRLKRLTLHGYKTFATKTEFEFGNGITAIVGPNGCGKSNIADAIRWVLGEQSYRTLRGQRTTDMIFAGSRSRTRAGMAQAILTLDNEEGWLPLDYSEIEIGRRAYRSGENEYILNRQRVRLRDVNELLANSGLGARTYTIIGQGLVDQALSLRAEERRSLFEEAAGITHYKLKRAETIRNLDETKHNLERVYDIISEIEPRMRSLRIQASRAQNYEQVAADLQHHLRIWFGYHWDRARETLRAAKLDSQSAQKRWDHGRYVHLELQESIDRTRSEISELVEELQIKEDDREKLRTRLESANREAAILSERLNHTQRRLSEIEEDVPRLKKQRIAAAEELEKAQIELDNANALLDKDMTSLSQFEQRVKIEESEIEKWELSISGLELKLVESKAKMNQSSGSLEQLKERLLARSSEVVDEAAIKEIEDVVEKRRLAAQSLEEAVAEERSKLAQLESDLKEAGASLRTIQEKQRHNQNQRQSLEVEIARLESRRQLMRSMHAVEPVDTSILPTNLGYLEDLITIEPEHEVAIRSALSGSVRTLVISNENDLWDVVSKLPPNSYIAGYKSLSERSAAAAVDMPGFIGAASSFVQSEAPISSLIELLLGRVWLLSVSSEEALKAARSLQPGYSVVTPEGLLVMAGGLIRTPAVSKEDIQKHRQELERIEASFQERVDQLAQASDDSELLDRDLGMLQVDFDNLTLKRHELVNQIDDSERSLLEANHALESAQSELVLLRTNQEKLSREIASLEERIRSTQEQIQISQSESRSFESSIEDANLKLKALPAAEIADQRRHLEQAIETAKTIVAGRQAVIDSRRSSVSQIDDQLDRIGSRIEDLRSQQVDIQLEKQLAKSESLQQEMDLLIAELEPFQETLREMRTSLGSLEKKLGEQLIQNQAAENQYLQARLSLSQAENRLEGLRERISTDLGLVDLPFDEDEIAQSPLPMEDVVDHLPTLDELPEDIEKTIQRLRGQLHRMGGINPEAPAEYEETRQRYDYLQKQVSDLTATIEQLQQVIIELDEITSRSFVETVEKVDEIFGQTFRRLFGGGTGRLILTDPEDLTTTGVDIVARLPNRREQALGLLSGGERSLTATALIFSLLMVSPTPFCVLDEVDAMLDEANVNRFREMLQELSKETQFIIITHNRGTVQVAESVYGVSMGADSASQVISIRPEEYVHPLGTG